MSAALLPSERRPRKRRPKNKRECVRRPKSSNGSKRSAGRWPSRRPSSNQSGVLRRKRDRLAANAAQKAAEAERLAAEKAKAEADAARQAALQQQQLLAQQAENADRARLSAEQDKERLRKQLLHQFNMILETRDTARGLIVNMSDVLFDTAK